MAAQRHSRAIVTLAIGRPYAELWNGICEPLWRRYGERHGYDVLCFDEPFDRSERARTRSPAWQKCLVLGQPAVRDYEQVVWVDVDMLPHPDAPSVADGVAPERVGAVDEYASPTPELHRLMVSKLKSHWNDAGITDRDIPTPQSYYAAFGLPGAFDAVVQTGMMVLSPSHHREILEHTYEAYEDKGPAFNYEMRPLSYELLAAGVVDWLDPRFNAILGNHLALNFPFVLEQVGHVKRLECVARARADTHFLHFAGSLDEMAPAAAFPVPSTTAARTASSAPRARLRAPIVLVVHARPDTTAALLEIVRAANPSRVFVVGDGPRAADTEQEKRCAAIRELIEEADFDCRLDVDFADGNLGLKRRIETGLDWVFEQVEEAIVLEDDCLPSRSFFTFCDELLERYRDDTRVLSISGDNFALPSRRPGPSYGFSRYPLIWGWATWRRAWRHYEPTLAAWPELEHSGWLGSIFDAPNAVQYWSYIFGEQRARGDTWDTAWLFASWLAGGLCVVPQRNLVTNVGFRDDATHTRTEFRGLFSGRPAEAIAFPLRHPRNVERDREGDAFIEDVMFSGNLTRMFERLRRAR